MIKSNAVIVLLVIIASLISCNLFFLVKLEKTIAGSSSWYELSSINSKMDDIVKNQNKLFDLIDSIYERINSIDTQVLSATDKFLYHQKLEREFNNLKFNGKSK